MTVQVDIKLDPALKSTWSQLVESTVLSRFWFQTSTCTPTARDAAKIALSDLRVNMPGREHLMPNRGGGSGSNDNL